MHVPPCGRSRLIARPTSSGDGAIITDIGVITGREQPTRVAVLTWSSSAMSAALVFRTFKTAAQLSFGTRKTAAFLLLTFLLHQISVTGLRSQPNTSLLTASAAGIDAEEPLPTVVYSHTRFAQSPNPALRKLTAATASVGDAGETADRAVANHLLRYTVAVCTSALFSASCPLQTLNQQNDPPLSSRILVRQLCG